jgi:hypothetical protein
MRAGTSDIFGSVMHWRKLAPWIAAIGAVVGVAYGDYTLVILAILLLAGSFFWPARKEEGED